MHTAVVAATCTHSPASKSGGRPPTKTFLEYVFGSKTPMSGLVTACVEVASGSVLRKVAETAESEMNRHIAYSVDIETDGILTLRLGTGGSGWHFGRYR